MDQLQISGLFSPTKLGASIDALVVADYFSEKSIFAKNELIDDGSSMGDRNLGYFAVISK